MNTSEGPQPFALPLGTQSPHGIPHQYVSSEPDLYQLVLPQNKRQRSNSHIPGTDSFMVLAHDTPSDSFSAEARYDNERKDSEAGEEMNDQEVNEKDTERTAEELLGNYTTLFEKSGTGE
ncbi:MAG: hypothetical protein Q9209_006023 [Squamulea sp. 1 TL-2023]